MKMEYDNQQGSDSAQWREAGNGNGFVHGLSDFSAGQATGAQAPAGFQVEQAKLLAGGKVELYQSDILRYSPQLAIGMAGYGDWETGWVAANLPANNRWYRRLNDHHCPLKKEIMLNTELDSLRTDLSIRAKNGVNFIIAASIIWFVVVLIWLMPYTAYTLSIFTFIAGSFMLPFAYVLGKWLNVEWEMKDNPLHKLGLWLNFAQLAYFPFLVFILLRSPEYFLMTYVIITGAHFLPFAWFYKEKAYAVMAFGIPWGAYFIAANRDAGQMYLVAGFMAVSLLIMSGWVLVTSMNR